MDFYRSLPSDNTYQIDFFGGEPLLNWDMVEFITETVSDDPRFKTLTMPSNGLLLTQEKVDFLRKNNINFSWSCDGIIEEDIDAYINKGDLIGQLCNSVSITATPDNLFFIENHELFVNTFKVIPHYRLAKEGWTPESVDRFRVEYGRYVDYIISATKRGEKVIPGNIVHDMIVLFEGVNKDTEKRRCVDSDLICLMPDGSTGFCALKCTNGDYTLPSDYDELYQNCGGCEITNFCAKGCYEMVRQNDGVDENLCDLYKFLLSQTIKINNSLKGNMVWRKLYMEKIFNDCKE
jgi:sulfatase maturation enzyme AslB (radical SAM superfamily)